MAFIMNFDKVTRTSTEGKAIGTFLAFSSSEDDPASMIQGKGTISVHTLVQDLETGKFNEPIEEGKAEIVSDLLEAVQRTYCGGTVHGVQVLQALSEMCELMWNGTFPEIRD
jgi:hypothetical protein